MGVASLKICELDTSLVDVVYEEVNHVCCVFVYI